MTAVLPLLPLYLQQIGLQGRDELRYWTGALSAAPFVIAVFATPLWGALADRIGHKPMVVRSVVGIAIASTGMGLSASPLALLAWRGVQGAVSGVFPAAVALLSSLTAPARLGRALAILQSSRSAGSLSGPLIGGILADLIGIRALFVGVGAIAALTAVVCALVLSERRRGSVDDQSANNPQWRELLAGRGVFGMLLMILIYQVAVMASWPTLALFVEEFAIEADSVATMTGLVVFAQGLPAMLLAPAWARASTRLGLRPLLVTALVMSGLANMTVGLAPNLTSVLALRALSGVFMAGFIPLSFHWLSTRTTEGARGRMAGISSTAMMLGNVIGSLLGGWISVVLDLGATFWVPGLALGATGILFALFTSSQRE